MSGKSGLAQYGPKFRRDISNIATGVSVHKADESTRVMEGIDETHFWWKTLEERKSEASEATSQIYRTFEVEELVARASPGLDDFAFGCRYVHSEFEETKDAITHFDGAIRAYSEQAFSERREVQINKAGKHSHYTKLFRIDGPLSVDDWQRLCHSFFRGNPLIAEYFGMESNSGELNQSQQHQQQTIPLASEPVLALVSYFFHRIDVERPTLAPNRAQETERGLVGSIEWCEKSEICKALSGQADVSPFKKVATAYNSINLPMLVIPPSQEAFCSLVECLAAALQADILAARFEQVSIAIAWPWEELTVSVALAGASHVVLKALLALQEEIDVASPPSQWVERVKLATSNGQRPSVPLHNLGVVVGFTGQLLVPVPR